MLYRLGFNVPPRPASLARYRFKTLLIVVILCLSSAATGAGCAYSQMRLKLHRGINSSLFMASPPAPPISKQLAAMTESSTIAVHSIEIDQLSRENQASIADRKTLHDEIYTLTKTEAADFNRLSSRLDVGEARVSTVLWVFGGLWSVGLALLLFFHFDERFKVTKVREREKTA